MQHEPVMLTETLEGLQVIPNGTYVDGTFGRGGHSQALLARLGPQATLFCLDKDPTAIEYGRALLGQDKRVTFFQSCFSQLPSLLNTQGGGKINGLLLDLGVSSPQLDAAERGFSFMREGPLDMRFDPKQPLSAADWVNTASQQEITWVLQRYGEEPAAKKIAAKICQSRQLAPLTTTRALADLITTCFPVSFKRHKHPATRSFQAIRLHINQELSVLKTCLKGLTDLLAPRARVAIISFHSLEDRQVKQFFQTHSQPLLPKSVVLPEKELPVPPFKWVVKRCYPSGEEKQRNRRSRSAILRVGERTDNEA